ncbi:hypothetical protein [Nostoc sp.]|uniref:hypothetical protein n=1 Tax=Nostoc sp. TaxID=1180 RepID=UPI002FFA1A75
MEDKQQPELQIKILGVAEQWDELGQAGEAGEAGEARGEFWKLLNHPATMQRQILKLGNGFVNNAA